jgi:hypothetical protein
MKKAAQFDEESMKSRAMCGVMHMGGSRSGIPHCRYLRARFIGV